MEQILASTASQDEISSRVSTLLAGTALSTTRGVDKVTGREIDMAGYETGEGSTTKLMLYRFLKPYDIEVFIE